MPVSGLIVEPRGDVVADLRGTLNRTKGRVTVKGLWAGAVRTVRRIDVDFNWHRDGLLRVLRETVEDSDDLRVGETVEAVDEDGTERLAILVAYDDQVLYLDVIPQRTRVPLFGTRLGWNDGRLKVLA